MTNAGPQQRRQIGNVVANFAGVGASFVFPLIFNIAYYRFLGSESYGLIGFYSTLVTLAALLDVGLGQTTVREVAKRSVGADSKGELRRVVFTLQFVFLCGGIVLALATMAGSTLLARHWLNTRALSTTEVCLLYTSPSPRDS